MRRPSLSIAYVLPYALVSYQAEVINTVILLTLTNNFPSLVQIINPLWLSQQDNEVSGEVTPELFMKVLPHVNFIKKNCNLHCPYKVVFTTVIP